MLEEAEILAGCVVKAIDRHQASVCSTHVATFRSRRPSEVEPNPHLLQIRGDPSSALELGDMQGFLSMEPLPTPHSSPFPPDALQLVAPVRSTPDGATCP